MIHWHHRSTSSPKLISIEILNKKFLDKGMLFAFLVMFTQSSYYKLNLIDFENIV